MDCESELRESVILLTVDDIELFMVGEREDVGVVIFEAGLFTDNPHTVTSELRDILDNQWEVYNYGHEGGKPFKWDSETQTETRSNVRVVKELREVNHQS